ncbi:MAG: selenocysteine-specific translation elongation factor [Deltaproteobacteria bacterium]|nr:selenocysteine-specific translation elongation factor [Deltaproteobacteria bacterium]
MLGTAGHIDHGKTSLVRALTGIDTDRLKEEKERGITIELGFAHLQLGELELGVVDVPGHERFIKARVAGAGGIDLVMLVIAADEGVMPQTREHLDICSLLGVTRGLVALTKVDLVEADWRALVVEDVRQALEGSFLEGAPIVPCSATSGEGLEELKASVAELAAELTPRDLDGLARLPIDRVFTVKGFGTVVTGSLLSGRLRLGDPVVVLPGEVSSAVRRLHVHGEAVEEARAGQRTAVNLGGVERQAVERGEVLVHPGTLQPSPRLDVKLRLLRGTKRALPARTRVLFHLGTRQQEAVCVLLEGRSLAPGGEALAQLRFDAPVVALPGDRFILRGFVKQESHGTTIGGGTVVRVLAPRLRPRDTEQVALLRKMVDAPPKERVALEVLAAGQPGRGREALQCRLPFPPGQVQRLVDELLAARELVRFDKEGGGAIHRQAFEELKRRAVELVEATHRESPLEAGMRREELRSRLGTTLDARLFHAVLSALERDGELVVTRETCQRPGHRVAEAAQGLEPVTERLRRCFAEAGLAPPRDAELSAQLGLPSADVASGIKVLLDQGTLVRIAGLLFDRQALEVLRGRLVAFLTERGQISAAEFKELVGQTRKFAIPLAEYFDAQKVTLRVGDLRKLRG